MLLAVQVRVLLLAGVPGGGMEERPQGHMQADPADAEDQEIVTHIIHQESIQPNSGHRAQKRPQGHMQADLIDAIHEIN